MILDTNAVSAFFAGVPEVCHRVGTSEELAVPSKVLVVDEMTARHYASIRRELKEAGHPIPENDLWIAALVRQHARPLLSDDAHFDQVAGIERIGW